MQDLEISFSVLKNIFINKAYASIELSDKIDKCKNKAFVTNLVYGVLDKSVEFDYYISKLTQKKPKNVVIVLIKMGMYLIKYVDSIPTYAAVSNMVDLCTQIGKREIKGFVNAILKNFSSTNIDLPNNATERLSIESSIPLWIVKKIINDYGVDLFKSITNLKKFDFENIRVNLNKYSMAEFKDLLKKNNIEYIESSKNSIFAKNDKTIKDLYSVGKVTIQSLTSIKCCEMLGLEDGDKVLDLCAAPGGKSVYLSELKNVDITACDIHEHRINLIKSYINRMGSKNISLKLNDATKINKEFLDSFDKVLCDVPCSGVGVFNKKPDVLLNLCEDDINSLTNVQYTILNNAKDYVKKNGILQYSTCTIFKDENERICKKFLNENKNFKIIEEKQFLPNIEGQDGFYVCKMEKIK